ncbi:MAG: hypothetical protein H8M99_07050 [Gloeobacteraceae cyanobacterium ES-bin-144]|nr:hypothetical protein [Verrucomicrobiales bacterium]
MNRLVIIPNEAHEALGFSLKARLASIAREINAHNLAQVMGSHALRSFNSLEEDQENELLLWAIEGKDYVVALASRQPKDEIEGRARADAEEGMIARVICSGRSEITSANDLEAADWTNLETLRGKRIEEMASSPVFLFENCMLVLSRVRYGGKESRNLSTPAELASLLGRLIEDRLIRATLGIEAT